MGLLGRRGGMPADDRIDPALAHLVPDGDEKVRSSVLRDQRAILASVNPGHNVTFVGRAVSSCPPMQRRQERTPMGLFSSKPKLQTCFFCSEAVAEGIETRNHYETHLIQVTDNNGHQAFTFNCPRCGLMDQAWGGGRSDPKGSALSALYLHLAQQHGRHDLLR